MSEWARDYKQGDVEHDAVEVIGVWNAAKASKLGVSEVSLRTTLIYAIEQMRLQNSTDKAITDLEFLLGPLAGRNNLDQVGLDRVFLRYARLNG